MPGAHHGLKTNYSIETNEGFARLQRMAGRDYEWPPPNSGNVNEEIYLNAVYGGEAEPDMPGEYAVYSLDWLENAERPTQTGRPDEELEAGAASQQTDALEAEEADVPEEAQRIPGEPIEDFAARLDDIFPGWVYNPDRGEIYVLKNSRGRPPEER